MSRGDDVVLEGRNLTCRYGGLLAVRDVSFVLRQGEILGLIGPNGAGKTTLISMVSGTVHTTEGQTYLKGRRITGLRPHEIARLGLARTFQVVKPLTTMTVRENVAVGALFAGRKGVPRAHQVAEETLAMVGLAEKANMSSAALSIADLKRLEVARALAMAPEVLLLDEVMAGLGAREIEAMMELIQALNQHGMPVLIVDHVLKAVMGISARVIVLLSGEKIADGTPSEVSSNPAVMSGYFGEVYSRRLQREASGGDAP